MNKYIKHIFIVAVILAIGYLYGIRINFKIGDNQDLTMYNYGFIDGANYTINTWLKKNHQFLAPLSLNTNNNLSLTNVLFITVKQSSPTLSIHGGTNITMGNILIDASEHELGIGFNFLRVFQDSQKGF